MTMTTCPRLENRLAPIMFWLSFAYLVAFAGLVHRANQPEATNFELQLIVKCLVGLWPIFVIEAVIAFLRRDRSLPTRRYLPRLLLVGLIPFTRMGWIHPATGMIWLPKLGWHPSGKALLKTLEKVFGIPMLVFAFLILPVLGAEYMAHDTARQSVPGFALAVDLGVAIIWIAFATELVIKAWAAPRTFTYLKEKWLDVAIVVLPTLEVFLTRVVDAAPLARLLRMGRAFSPDQVARLGKVYRLRGLLMKGWHAFLLIEGVARITGRTPEKRLLQIEEQIADLETVLDELRAERDALRERIAANADTQAEPMRPSSSSS
jgi:hypothetical protein